MSEQRRIKIVVTPQGFAHVYVVGTDIELSHVLSWSVEHKAGHAPVAHLEILDAEVEAISGQGEEETKK